MKRCLAVFLMIVLSACTKDDSDSPQERGEAVLCSRITNGDSCSDPDASSVVLLLIKNTQGIPFEACSGTVIAPDKILTAAHCIPPAGSIDVYVEGRVIGSRQLIANPSHQNFAGAPHDIAIVVMEDSVGVAPVPITLSRRPEANDLLKVYGYGVDENGDSAVNRGTDALQESEMVVSEVRDGFILLSYNVTKSSICSGDSGGPATLRSGGAEGVVGVASAVTADTQCLDDTTALFTDVQDNLDFLNRTAPDALYR